MKHLVIVILAVLFSSASWAEGSLKEYSGTTPALSAQGLDGNIHTIGKYTDQVVMVQFWATYCVPCRTEMPSMNRLARALGDDFKILAINMGEPKTDVQRFVDEVHPEFDILLDPNGENIQAWNVFAVPATFIVDPKGQIRYSLFGPAEWDTKEMQNTLAALMD